MITSILKRRWFHIALSAFAVGGWASSGFAQYRVGTPGVIDTSPAPVPPVTVQEVSLHNPRTRGAKSYVDFDSGKTFTWGESKPEDFTGSRKWINTTGVDLMCETTAPADGFASYDLVLVPINMPFDQLNDYNAIANPLRDQEARPFDLVKVARKLPATYVFRTREGAIGVMEIIGVDTADEDMKLRYKVIPKPPPPTPVRATRFGQAGAIAVPGNATVIGGVLRGAGMPPGQPPAAPADAPFSADNFRLDRPIVPAPNPVLPGFAGAPAPAQIQLNPKLFWRVNDKVEIIDMPAKAIPSDLTVSPARP